MRVRLRRLPLGVGVFMSTLEALQAAYDAEVSTFTALGGGNRTEEMGIEQHFAIAQCRRRIEKIRKEIRNLLEETT